LSHLNSLLSNVDGPAIAKINSQIQQRMTPLEEIIERQNGGSQAPPRGKPFNRLKESTEAKTPRQL
jgi:hypothetical protein